ncbi:MAG TPA: hypothetical protein VMW51_07630 [Terriglobia bacterium]|nr:hypothetical protein [Terriglobia bacterium]
MKPKTKDPAQAGQPFLNQLQHRVIGHQFAVGHLVECHIHGGSEFGGVAVHRGAEDVARGKMAGAEPFAEALGLGALAHTGRTQQDDAPGMAERPAWRHEARMARAHEPGGAVLFGHGPDRVGPGKKPVVLHVVNLAEDP